jgi:1,4-dihydroxy-2-naphthoyl-CoA hydrolase
VVGKILVTEKLQQPMGILHGGASVTLAEGLGSFGAALHAVMTGSSIVGLEINANHINSVSASEGVTIVGEARPKHIGKNTHVWEIVIRREDNLKIVCISRLTCLVMKSKM